MLLKFAYPFILGTGKETAVLDELLKTYADPWGDFISKLSQNEFPQLSIPERMSQEAPDVYRELQSLQDVTDDVVVIGIGGSSLGLVAIHSFLFGHTPYGYGGALPKLKKRVRVVEMPSDEEAVSILQEIDPARTRFLVISKSGNTLETILGFLTLLEPLKKTLGEEYLKDHAFFVTDPESSPLLALARRLNSRVYGIPKEIGGRFSILGSPMASVFLGLLGVEASPLFKGAQKAKEELLKASPDRSVPFLLGSGLYEALKGLNKPVWVPFGYGEPLEGAMLWLRQLVSESLGKQGRGLTPLSVKGPSDQHSILQLFEDGPDDKTYTFFSLLSNGRSGEPIGWVPEELAMFDFIKGKRLEEVWEALCLSSYLSLASKGRPVSWMGLEKGNLESLGAFFFLMEAMVIYLGGLFEVNPFDQPAVEHSKRMCRALLGGPGLDEERKGIEGLLHRHRSQSIET